MLFTDVVDSTATAARLGDQRWAALLDRHDGVLRSEVERARGRVVKTTGDGLLATFNGPARAIRCARAIVARAGELGLQVRAGLHAGECELRGDDVAGLTVHIVAQSRRLPLLARCSLAARCATSYLVRTCASTIAAATSSRECPGSGRFSLSPELTCWTPRRRTS